MLLLCISSLWWLSGKESSCQCRRHGFDSCVGKTPYRRKWQPTPIFLPGDFLWTEETGGLPSMESQRVGYDLMTKQQQHKLVISILSGQNHTLILFFFLITRWKLKIYQKMENDQWILLVFSLLIAKLSIFCPASRLFLKVGFSMVSNSPRWWGQ